MLDIGENSTVGAGSVVVHDVDKDMLVAGNRVTVKNKFNSTAQIVP